VLVVEDARLDARFHDKPLVTGANPIRFYAGVPVRSPDGHSLGALCVIDSKPRAGFSQEDRSRLQDLARLVEDRLELRRIEVGSQQGVSKFGRVAETSPDGIISLDEGGNITAINPAAEAIFGHRTDSLIGRSLSVLLPSWGARHLLEVMARSAEQPRDAKGRREDFIGRRADGSHFPLEIAWSAWTEGEARNFGIVVRDLTDQRRHEDELTRLANVDEITGLPNLGCLKRWLEEAVSADRSAIVVLLGITELQELSDALGLADARKLFKIVSSRLRHCVRSTDLVARVTADQFAMVLFGLGDPIRARETAEAAIAAVFKPISLADQSVRLTASAGIALWPSHADSADELLANAGLALQEARREEHGRISLFTPGLRSHALSRRLFDAELHQAVERGEFQVFYQPQVRLSDGALTGAEALLRWNHPERGLLLPNAFLDALENSSLASVVGNWVIDAACKEAGVWRQSLWPDFRISVNVFASQFSTGNLRSFLRDVADRYEMPPGSIELEITETTVIDDEARFLPLLEGLRQDGIELAFDDFGTGFASLSMAARYPLTHLKIDKSFVQRAFLSDRDRIIVEAITELAHRLGLQVIAEGIETHRLYQFCQQIGCDEAQGYLLGKPMPAAAFEAASRSRLTLVPRLREQAGLG
jgi:PAS domain S-box-containing protein/diguanylate cyclase (GGDEF)-like protein